MTPGPGDPTRPTHPVDPPKPTLSSWSIRHPAPTALLFVLLTVAGLLAWRVLPVQSFPDIDVPIVSVTVRFPGASPSQLEADVVRPIEDAIAALIGVRHIESTLRDGEASIVTEFLLDKPTAEAVDDVRDAVARVRSDLPGEILDPVVRKVAFTGAMILAYAVGSSRLDDQALSWFVDHEVTRVLRAVRGVGEVARVGGVSRQIRVDLDAARLLAMNITPAEVSQPLRDVQRDATGGRSDTGAREHAVRVLGSVATADDLGALDLPLADGRIVRLDRLGSVTDGVAERRSAAFLDGRPVVGIEVRRARGASDIDTAERVRAALADLQARTPGLTVTEAVDRVEPTAENFRGSLWLLVEGSVLAIVVVLCFLRDVRATLIAAIALPLSVIPTFAAMQLMGFSLNVVTLLALSLVIGILVDDAIVEIENIERHMAPGRSPHVAAMRAADEIGLAVVATTVALIAVFLPTAFMSGVVGKFFVQFGWTAALAVLFSLLVARMLTPMLSAWTLRAQSQSRPLPPTRRWVERVVRAADACLRHRGLTVLATVAVIGGGGLVASRLSSTFIPPADDAFTQVQLTLPPGSRLDETVAAADRALVLLRQEPAVRQVYTTIGAGSAGADPVGPQDDGGGNVRVATMIVRVGSRAERPGRGKPAIEQSLRAMLADLPGVRIRIGGEDDGQRYELVLAGKDDAQLMQQARRIEQALRETPGVGAVISSADQLRPELVVRPDFARAAALGVTSTAIAETLRVATTGDQDAQRSKLNLADRQVPVLVRLGDRARDDPDVLRQLLVRGAHGPVPLANVATFEIASGPAEITRYDRMRNVRLEIEPDGGLLGDLEAVIDHLPALRSLPPGIMHAGAGDAESMGELMTGFLLAMAAGVLCIHGVLVLLFGSFMLPFTIIAALLLSIPGAFIALAVTGSALSMPSMIGLIMLMGIAAKNAILLVDYIVIARRDHGLARHAAVLDACAKRARPIVMTSVAMGAGMLPIAIGLGADPSFRSPMAIVVIGGLVTSTALSLLVVPVAYTVVDDVSSWARRLAGRADQR